MCNLIIYSIILKSLCNYLTVMQFNVYRSFSLAENYIHFLHKWLKQQSRPLPDYFLLSRYRRNRSGCGKNSSSHKLFNVKVLYFAKIYFTHNGITKIFFLFFFCMLKIEMEGNRCTNDIICVAKNNQNLLI